MSTHENIRRELREARLKLKWMGCAEPGSAFACDSAPPPILGPMLVMMDSFSQDSILASLTPLERKLFRGRDSVFLEA